MSGLIGIIITIFLIVYIFTGWPWSLFALILFFTGISFLVIGAELMKKEWKSNEKFKSRCLTGLGDLSINMGIGFFLVGLIQWIFPLAVGDNADPQWVLQCETSFIKTAESIKSFLNPVTGQFFFTSLFVIAVTLFFPTLYLLPKFNKTVKWAGRLSTILSTLLLFTFFTVGKFEGQWMLHFKDKFNDPVTEIQKDRGMAATVLYQYEAVADMLSGNNLSDGVTALSNINQNSDLRDKYKQLGDNYWNPDYFQFALNQSQSITVTSSDVEESLEKTQNWLQGDLDQSPTFDDMDRLNTEADRLHHKIEDIKEGTTNLIQNAISNYALQALNDQQQDFISVFIGAFVAYLMDKGSDQVERIKGYFGQSGRLSLEKTDYWSDKHPAPGSSTGETGTVVTPNTTTFQPNVDLGNSWHPYNFQPVPVIPWTPPVEEPHYDFVP